MQEYVKTLQKSWRNEPKHWGGGAQSLRGSGRAGGGCPPPTVRSFFIFRLENVQSGAYLRRKFGLDDMYYMGKRVTIRPTGKRVCFSWTRKHIILWKYAPQNNLRKISNTCQRYTKYYITYNVLIWRRYPDVETREWNERAGRGCDAVGCHSNAVSFYYLWYGATCIYKRQYTDIH